MSAETSAASSTKLAPQAAMHHSTAVVQKSIVAATQNAAGSRPRATDAAGGVAIATSRCSHQAAAGTSSEASSATRQPAPVAAASESAPIRIT